MVYPASLSIPSRNFPKAMLLKRGTLTDNYIIYIYMLFSYDIMGVPRKGVWILKISLNGIYLKTQLFLQIKYTSFTFNRRNFEKN